MGQFNLFGVKIAFGKSKTTLKVDTNVKERLTDINADPDAKIQMQHLADYLKHPDEPEVGRIGIFSGVILTGSSGTDKVLAARAIAGEAGVMLFSISGQEFAEDDTGIAASRVHAFFVEARKHAPCVMFIDKIGAFAGLNASKVSAQQELKKQLCSEMDGDSNKGIVLMSSADNLDQIDPIFLRSGRFNCGFRIEPAADKSGNQACVYVQDVLGGRGPQKGSAS